MDTSERLRNEGREQLTRPTSSAELEEARVAVLGRSSPLTAALRELPSLAPEKRKAAGASLNRVRQELEAVYAERRDVLAGAELEVRLAADAVDVTLPGDPVAIGVPHLLTQTTREIEDIFIGLGYRVAEGPELDLDYYNFTALNTPEDHPARLSSDTFWVSDHVALRPQTSPVQVRAMEQQPPPIYIVCPGRCYRRDALDATHSPWFMQVEGLAVDRGLTLADLKGTLEHFARELFGGDRKIRLRSHFFPFTEPSVEIDVSCFLCEGAGCAVCKQIGWIELGGAGVVDPNVYSFVEGYDPEEISGFAFGWGIERIAMLKHGITHIRNLYDNDLRFNEQWAGSTLAGVGR